MENPKGRQVDYFEEYERLKMNVKMYLKEVDSLITEDTELLVQLNNFRIMYIGDI